MYKIMLADDEGIVIQSLTFIIEKHFKGQYELCSAKTGRKVIELAEQFRPDIAFMDIQMPGINGIEAMKEMKKTNPETIFIILSAYDKFTYAQEAISLGALEYLNKPVNQKVIVEVLQRAMLAVEARKEKRRQDLQMKEKLEVVMPVIESSLIYAILFQEECPEDMEKYQELLGIAERYGYMLVIEYGDDIEDNDLSNTVGTSIKAQHFSYALREIVKEYFDGIVGASMTNKTVVFVPSATAELSYSDRVARISQARQMVRYLAERIDVAFRVGIGGAKEVGYLIDSYREAIYAMKHATGKVVHFLDLPSGKQQAGGYQPEKERTLLSRLKQGKSASVREEALHYFDYLMAAETDCGMDKKLKLLEVVLHSEKTLLEGSTPPMGVAQTSKNYLEELADRQSLESLCQWFLQRMEAISIQVQTAKQDPSQLCIEKAKTYIKAHYNQDLSLESVSCEVDISPYYFSKLFKQVTGENFVEYLTGLRMERGKELLHKGYSIKQVGIEIGYSDPNYFSRNFKKYVGVTPTEFKEAGK